MLFGWISLSSIGWVFIHVAMIAAWISNLGIVSDFSFSGDNLDFPIISEHFISSFWPRNLKHAAAPYAIGEASAKLCNSFGVSLQNPCRLGISILLTSLTFSFLSNHKFSNLLRCMSLLLLLVRPCLISTARDLEWWVLV